MASVDINYEENWKAAPYDVSFADDLIISTNQNKYYAIHNEVGTLLSLEISDTGAIQILVTTKISSEASNDILLKVVFPFMVYRLTSNNTILLHSTCISNGKNTIAFLGRSTVGKSTLAGFFSENTNYCILTDDVLPVVIEDGNVYSYHLPTMLKLNSDSMVYLGKTIENNPSERYLIRQTSQWGQRIKLNSIYLLDPAVATSEIHLHALTGITDRMRLIVENLYAQQLGKLDNRFLSKASKLARADISFCRATYKKKWSLISTLMYAILGKEGDLK